MAARRRHNVEGMLRPALSNEPLDDDVRWHPTKEALAFSVLESRHSAMGWILQHRFGLQKLHSSEIVKLLRVKEPIDEPNPITAQVKRWKGDELHIAVSWSRDN